MFDWLKFKKKDKPQPDAGVPEVPQELADILTIRKEGKQARAIFDFGNRAEKEQPELLRAFSEHSGISVFNGRVEHAWTLERAGRKDACPRCKAPTRQQYAGFVYATQSEPGVNTSPAGYFCTKCPTVVIDEEFIAGSVLGGRQFRGVVALDTPAQGLMLFKTWNGKEPVYFMNDDGQMAGIAAKDEMGRGGGGFALPPGDEFEDSRHSPVVSHQQREYRKKRNRQASASRKHNRKKK